MSIAQILKGTADTAATVAGRLNLTTLSATLTKAAETMEIGRELANAETWKNRTVAVNTLAALLTGLLAISRMLGFDVGLTDQDLVNLANGAAGILFLFNSFSTLMTTKKIGATPSEQPPAPQAADEA